MISAILLAAGASRRMGRDKLGMAWRASTVLTTTLERWLAVPSIAEVVLVRRAPDENAYGSKVRVVINANPEEGMGSSLRVGALAVANEARAVVMGLGDMPNVETATIAALIGRWEELGEKANAIVVPAWKQRRGHPVLFGLNYLPMLRSLGGDRGARDILTQWASQVVLMPTQDPGVCFDIDTMRDYEGGY